MMKRFLSTTAILISLSGAAYAESHTTAGFGTVAAASTDFFASDLIGMRVYNSEAQIDTNATIAADGQKNWDDIGEINDIIVGADGNVKAVILGIGGFLGMGERDVSVSMDAIKVVRQEGDSNDRFLVVNTTKQALEQAPEFDRKTLDVNANAAGSTDLTQATKTENAGSMKTNMDNNASMDNNHAKTSMNEQAKSTMADGTVPAKDAQADQSNVNKPVTDRPLLTPPAVKREGYANADMNNVSKLTADDLEGATVYGANDENVGEIDSLIMGDNGQVSQVVINVGGFLGLGEKPVAVTWDELQIMQSANGDDFRIYIDSNKDALKAQPEYQG